MERRTEQTILGASWLGAILVAFAGLVAIIDDRIPAGLVDASLYTAMGGLLLLAGIALALFNVDVLTHLHGEGDRYEALRRRGRLRAAAILLRALGWLGTLVFILGLALRGDIIDWSPPADVARRGVLLLAAALTAAVAYGHNQSLHVELERDRSDLRRIGTALVGIVAILATAIAGFLVGSDTGLLGGALRPEDAPMVLLLATVLLALTVTLSRHLPSMAAAVLDPGRQTEGGYTPESRAQLAPTVVAFTVLGGFLLILILLSAGVVQVLQRAGENGLIFLALLLMVAAVVGGIILSVRTGKQADRTALYRQATESEVRERMFILGISLPLAAILLIMALLMVTGRDIGPFSASWWIHVGSLGILVGLGPYGYYAGQRHRRIRQMEERFPDFLRDLSSSHRGGLTLPAAVQVAARGEYGPLSPEVVKMADQLTWHVSFEEALQRMADRVRTPLVRRTISLILEASRSGGNTADVLSAAARDARELKTLERQRRINMSVYTIVIYVVFFVFLFVIGVLYAQFVPAILEAEEATQGSQFEGVGGLNFGGVTQEDYRRFYVTAGMVQAIGNGILAGVMGNASATLGLRHAFWMALTTYVTFAFIL